jgi:Domain of unknown function (DUF4349)/Putative zinc-finger
MSISNHPVEHQELMAYLDGELPAGRAADTAAHLEQCPECRQLAADLREVSEMLAAWRVEEAEAGLPQQLAAALDKKVEKPTRSTASFAGRLPFPVGRRLLWAGAAAVVLCLVIAISVPMLLKSRISANDSSAAALARSRATSQVSGLQPPKIEFENGRAHLPVGKVPRAKGDPPPSPAATPYAAHDSLNEIASNEQEEAADQEKPSNVPAVNGPMIIRTAELEITTDAFDKARAGVEEILKRHHGYVGELNVETPAESARSLIGTLRVPAAQLEATLSDLKGLGRTEKESQGGEEVTQRYVDLEARLANSKHTEQRLVEMLRDRTGKLSDVLAVELQISRVRGEIEQMEAERKSMKNQVDLATITITLAEAYKAELKAVPPSAGTQFRNAAVEGYRSLVDGIIAVLLWLLSAGPTLLVWAAILFFPVKMVWKKVKPRLATSKNSN